MSAWISQRLHHPIQIETARFLAWWKFLECCQKSSDILTGRKQNKGSTQYPVIVSIGGELSAFVRILPQIENKGKP